MSYAFQRKTLGMMVPVLSRQLFFPFPRYKKVLPFAVAPHRHAGGQEATFPYYSSLSFNNNADAYESVEMAFIVIHGANRNADDYFNFVMSSLLDEDLAEKVLVVAPEFLENGDSDRLYWRSRGWREGQVASGPLAISSFSVIDSLSGQVLRNGHFPNLKKLVITGHSSGGLFTHVYSASNSIESQNPTVDFDYIIANSQYFYYPDGRRVKDNGNNKSLYQPQNCSGYDIWPTGFRFAPNHLPVMNRTNFNQRFKDRSLIYLLGDLEESDPSLNTSDCYATLLGSTRFDRGKNMLEYMRLVYGDEHGHQEITVSGVGHDALGMYMSLEFRNLVKDLLGE